MKQIMDILWLFVYFPIPLALSANHSGDIRFVNEVVDIKYVVESGMKLAREHCQQQFKWDRWNCPETAFIRQSEEPVYRETAFVQAITASGIVYSITQGCSKGVLDCGCVRHHREYSDERDWLWGSCSDNVNVGIELAQDYLDSVEKNSYLHNYIKIHNYAVSQEAVRHCLELKCKCYGPSGSCTTKVCWKQLCPFHIIAMDLRFRYDRAVRLNLVEENPQPSWENTVHKIKQKIRGATSRHLIYSDTSPNYCVPDETLGWSGTRGRICSKRQDANVSFQEKTSCRTLCRSCNYNVKKKVVTVTYRCNCTLQWCCHVECDVCSRNYDEFYCD